MTAMFLWRENIQDWMCMREIESTIVKEGGNKKINNENKQKKIKHAYARTSTHRKVK